MPRGKVHDDGDPGNMNGQRIGIVTDAKTGTIRLPFNNGPLGGEKYYEEDDFVQYRARVSLTGQSIFAEMLGKDSVQN